MPNQERKVALVTGASSGIGEATARALGEAGVNVALAARRQERLEKIAAEISTDPSRARAFALDVTRRDDVGEIVKSVREHFGRIDILVNNAGIMPLSFLKNLHEDEWNRMVDVNIKGVLNCTAAVLPIMLEQKVGHVVNVSSLAGRRVFPAGSVYCATKFFVCAFSDGLRMELSPHDNIRVTTIEPALTRSELTDSITDQEVRERISGAQNLHILDSEDIANAIVYAVSQPQHVNVNEILIRPTVQET